MNPNMISVHRDLLIEAFIISTSTVKWTIQ